MTDEEAESMNAVYCAFGMTAHLMQNFEKELASVLLLPTLNQKAKPQVAGELERIRALVDKQTLGTLIEWLRPIATFGPGAEDKILEAKKRRNFLMHDYFPARQEQFRTMSGRAEMVRELYELQDFVRPIYRRLSDITRESFKYWGVSEQQLEEFIRNKENEA